MIETRPALHRDAFELAPRLRVEDAGEIGATWHLGARDGLCLCLLQSDRSFALVESDEVIGLWGVSSLDVAGLRLGLPWLLAAERLFARQREVVRHSRDWVERLLLDYDVLTNLTLASNATHLRWLAWCGFRMLRVHRRHGWAGVPYCEFYRVNPLRHAGADGIRETLLGRPVRERPELDPLTLRSARFAAAGFPAEALPELLDAVQQRHLAGGRVRPTIAALLVEAATVLCRRGLLTPPLREWASNLLAVAETAHLDGLAAADLVFALDTARCGTAAGALPAKVPSVSPPRGLGGLAVLTRHFVETLTLAGRVGRIPGRRLRLAAIGVSEETVRRPLGVPMGDLVRAWNRLWPATGAVFGGPAAAAVTAPDGLVARLRGAVADHGVGRVLAGEIDRWACDTVTAAPAGSAGGGHVAAAAAVIADRASRQLLPAPRSGGVLAGYVERQHLYWLLRCRLQLAADGSAPLIAALNVGALLVAGDAERRLVSSLGPQAPEDDLAAVIDAVAAVFGPDTVTCGGDLERLLAVLAPAFTVASVHGAQLGPALLAWHLLMDGSLDEVLAQVSEILSSPVEAADGGYRALLRRRSRQVTAASLERHLLRLECDASVCVG